jgi:diadenosine tetraphosphate (Ap4A) HIT family hydrolase
MLADGAAAMQTVFHVHIHAVPRRNGDKLRMASHMIVRRNSELEHAAAQVRLGLERLVAEGR